MPSLLEQYIEKNERELNILKSLSGRVELSRDMWGRNEFITRNYADANEFRIKQTCGCCADAPYIVQFIANLSTSYGKLETYVRHEEWETDGKDTLLTPDNDGEISAEEAERAEKEWQNLRSFYKEKGAKEELLLRIDKKVSGLIERLFIEHSKED